MTNRHLPRQFLQHIIGKDFRHQAHALDVRKMLSIGRGDAGGFLPAMLQRVQAEIRHPRRIGMAVNGNDTALLVEGVIIRGQG